MSAVLHDAAWCFLPLFKVVSLVQPLLTLLYELSLGEFFVVSSECQVE